MFMPHHLPKEKHWTELFRWLRRPASMHAQANGIKRPDLLIVIYASVELTLIIVLRANFPTPELPTLIKSVDRVEGA